jgi:hypothetical protein
MTRSRAKVLKLDGLCANSIWNTDLDFGLTLSFSQGLFRDLNEAELGLYEALTAVFEIIHYGC